MHTSRACMCMCMCLCVCVLVRVCVCLCVCVCVSTLAILISGRLQFVPCVPCWAGMDFGGPKAGKDTDAGKLGKLAQRVEKILQEQVVFREPKQLDPSSILVAPLNRDGAPPNVPHIHQGILAGFFEKGFDSTRPQAGICVEFKSPEGKRKLLQHNYRFSRGSLLLPRIEENKVLYGSLAGSHLNLALRLIQQ